MLYLDLFCAFVSRMCPKVIVSLLYAISAYERFHRNTLLSDSGGNLYGFSVEVATANVLSERLANYSTTNMPTGF